MPRETAEDREIVKEAQKRFKACQDWESRARERFNADQKFAEGDSDNQFQWDAALVRSRTTDVNGPRPCLTINKTRQHCLQILNDARQNKAQIRVNATGGGATYDSAQIFQGITRYIEYRSNATEAYEAASRHQVYGGIGYWRILSEYVSEDSFDQDLKIQRVPDPLSIYLDPHIQEFNGSDARFGFAFIDMPRDQFEIDYPEWKDKVGKEALDDEGKSWSTEDTVRIAEYYRRREVPDTLYALADGSMMLRSEIPPDLREQFDAEKPERVRAERPTHRVVVEWFKIAGSRVIDRKPWPGRYIPIVRVIGEETVIDGELDRKGHTRAMKDPQRMYNYASSGAVEFGALQGKSPFIAPAAAIEGYENMWNAANRENFSVLVWNHMSDDSGPIPAPQRAAPPASAPHYLQLMQSSLNELMLVSGQYQAEMGAPSNERSGVAIQQRQRQGDNATYHYIDHLAQAIRLTGVMLLDLIPHFYDTERVIKILGEDGSQTDVRIDPTQSQPLMKTVAGKPANDEMLKTAQADPDMRDKVETIFNPAVGRYSVQADVGPAFATKRQEMFNALREILTRSPDLAKLLGDYLFMAADFPMATEMAERFRRTIPPAVLGQGPSPAEQQLQQQVQQLQGALGQAMQAAQGLAAQAKDRAGRDGDEMALKAYDAETRRLTALVKQYPQAFGPAVMQLVADMQGTDVIGLHQTIDAHAGVEAAREAMVGLQRQPNPPQPTGAGAPQ
jgi:hypothetical protein